MTARPWVRGYVQLHTKADRSPATDATGAAPARPPVAARHPQCQVAAGRMPGQQRRSIGDHIRARRLPDQGRRPVHGGAKKFQEDPHWRDLILFYEYFHGDNGAGLGASHQTGWTGIVARAMHLFATTPAERVLQLGKRAVVTEVEPAKAGQSAGA